MSKPSSGSDDFLRRIIQLLKRIGLVLIALKELIRLLIKLMGGDDM